MKKLRLEIDELAVESFATLSGLGQSGTVEAFRTQFGHTCDAEPSWEKFDTRPKFIEPHDDPKSCVVA